MIWHQTPIEEIFTSLESSAKGLTDKEAQTRLAQYGKNSLPSIRRITFWKIVLHQFTSPLIYVLLFAGVLSVSIKEYEDSIFIFLIILFNAIIGTYQEWKAESNASALQDLMKAQATVLRNGTRQILDAELLVKGDIIYLESGMKVPADLRLFQSHNLCMEEALLTGESLPITKSTDLIVSDSVTISDRLNMAYAGTTVMSGRGLGIVVETALKTEIGKIADSLSDVGTQKAPLVERMERFAQKISIAVLVVAILVVLIGWQQGIPLTEIFFVAVAMVVSAIPEGLPIAMTVALSIATARMVKRNVIVRKLSAVEGLGSCTYIASDKTGTLTVDQQTVKKLVFSENKTASVSGEGYNGEGKIASEKDCTTTIEQMVEAVTICNEAVLNKTSLGWQHQGDAIDVALLALSYKINQNPEQILEQTNILHQIPFESANKYAATCYEKGGKKYIIAKGAVEVIADKAPDHEKNYFVDKAEELAQGGFRVIAVGIAEINDAVVDTLPQQLHLLGLVALIDPIKPEAKLAIEDCHKAGLKVAMVTGDHPATAFAIAKELHIASHQNQIITGKEMAAMDEAAIKSLLDEKTVFARVSPSQKMQIVRILQEKGNFVAVTGDGVNDAPALKSAHIGVAMGYGTDVAKEASSIIITDNNFTSIAAGVEEGRYAYDNLRKIIYFLISSGFAEILMIVLALIFGLPIPLLAVQLLWINLVTNGIQDVTMAFEKGEREVMSLPPRDPKEGVFNRKMLQQVFFSGLLMAILSFGLWYMMLNVWNYSEYDARNAVVLLMVLLQNFHAMNCRSERKSVFKIPLSNNWLLVIGILSAQGLHILAMHIPFLADMLQIHPIGLQEWLSLLGLASLILLTMEVYKRLLKNT